MVNLLSGSEIHATHPKNFFYCCLDDKHKDKFYKVYSDSFFNNFYIFYDELNKPIHQVQFNSESKIKKIKFGYLTDVLDVGREIPLSVIVKTFMNKRNHNKKFVPKKFLEEDDKEMIENNFIEFIENNSRDKKTVYLPYVKNVYKSQKVFECILKNIKFIDIDLVKLFLTEEYLTEEILNEIKKNYTFMEILRDFPEEFVTMNDLIEYFKKNEKTFFNIPKKFQNLKSLKELHEISQSDFFCNLFFRSIDNNIKDQEMCNFYVNLNVPNFCMCIIPKKFRNKKINEHFIKHFNIFLNCSCNDLYNSMVTSYSDEQKKQLIEFQKPTYSFYEKVNKLHKKKLIDDETMKQIIKNYNFNQKIIKTVIFEKHLLNEKQIELIKKNDLRSYLCYYSENIDDFKDCKNATKYFSYDSELTKSLDKRNVSDEIKNAIYFNLSTHKSFTKKIINHIIENEEFSRIPIKYLTREIVENHLLKNKIIYYCSFDKEWIELMSEEFVFENIHNFHDNIFYFGILPSVVFTSKRIFDILIHKKDFKNYQNFNSEFFKDYSMDQLFDLMDGSYSRLPKTLQTKELKEYFKKKKLIFV